MSSVPTVSQLPNAVLDTVTATNLDNIAGAVPTVALWQMVPTAPTSIVQPITTASTTIVVPGTGSSDGIPTYVGALAASESPYKNKNGQMFTAVSISFIPPVDVNWAGVQIWFSGYNGNPYPQLMATGSVSPLSFLVETTGETVLVTANSISPSGFQPLFTDAPTTTVTINGVLSAPSPPSIANSLSTTPTGYQFQFNYISGLSADVIMSYNIYKNSSNSFPGSAGFVKSVNQPSNLTADPSATGVYTYQETVTRGISDYYWVTSINQIGLESTPTFAGNADAQTPIDNSGNLLFRNINTDGGAGLALGSNPTNTNVIGHPITITTTGHSVLLLFSGIVTGISAPGVGAGFTFTRTAGLTTAFNSIGLGTAILPDCTVSSSVYPTVMTYIDKPVAGTYTYSVWGTQIGGVGTVSVQAYSFQAIEFA